MAPENYANGRAARTWAFCSVLELAQADEIVAAPDQPAAPDARVELEAAPRPIEALDKWARYIWRNKRFSPWILLALPVWIAIRAGYALNKVGSTVGYYALRPFHWLYWRIYEVLGVLARVGSWVFWRLLYEPLHMLWRGAKALFWKLIYPPIELVWRGLKAAYWRAVHPLLSLAWRALNWIYWRILYPPLEFLWRGCVWSYWRFYEVFGPLGRGLMKVYWVALYPAVEALGRAGRYLYWNLIHPLRGKGAGVRPAERSDRSTQPQRRDALRDAFAAGLHENDAIAWCAGSQADVEALFDCLPRFGLTKPAPASLHILLGHTLAETSERQLKLLGQRLRSGAPCQRVHLYAADSATASAVQGAFGAPVHLLSGCDEAEFVEDVRARALEHAPSLTLTQFGPVVLLVSALWGRVGSTMIFDAQTQFLIENGAVVVRVFVDHNPKHGAERAQRREMLLQENLSNTYPTLTVIAERDESMKARADLRRRPDYKKRSGIRRFELELEGAKALDEGALAWAGANAQLAIVNHAVHMAFTERVTKAPIVLETHDVLTHQIESHGWPDWVSLSGEPKALRDDDQRDMWRRAAVCVNLTPNDHEEIAKYARAAMFVRPTAEPAAATLRPWADVVAANDLSAEFAAREDIDILLWGDWHNGNVRAVEWFLEHVAADPRLANARIAVIGRVTRNVSQSLLRRHPNVVTTGFVDRLGDFFGRTKILAIADRDASGVSIKAIEAIRFGHAFVSTKAGLRGLDTSGVDFRPCETVAAFADDLVALLKSPAALAARSAMARKLFEQNISHDAYERQWREVIAKAAPTLAPAELTAEPAASPGPALLLQPVTRPTLVVAPETPPVVVQTLAPKPLAPGASAPAATQVAPKRTTHVLAAVICTYNRYDVLPGAIESLLAQDIAPGDLDILVIDNSPDQDAARVWADKYEGTRVRYLLEPIPGLSNARNVGAQACAAKYVAYIDDDAVAAPDWARNLVAGLRKFPKAGVAGGRIIPRWITPRPDWLPDELVGNLSIVDWGGKARELGRTEWIAGCNIAFERNTLLEVGGFSRALGRVGSGVALLSNEESEVIEKFAEAGRNAIYVPEAMVEHLIEPARLSQDWFRRRAAWQAVSDYIKNPKQASTYARSAAERLRRELASEQNALPPGFVRPDSEREQFRHDVGLMYDTVIAMLAGGVELSEDGSSDASLQEKLIASVRREMQRNPQLRSTIRKLANI